MNSLSPQSPLMARVAGLGLLLMFFAAVFSNFVVVEGLIIPTDAAKTAAKILENPTLFRFGMIGFFVVLVCDVLVTWALYLYMKQLNDNLSLLAAYFRLVYTAIFAVAILHLYQMLLILQNTNTAFTTQQIEVQALMSYDSFQLGWLIGLLFFGFHLLTLGYLILTTNHVPRAIGFLLVLAGIAYTADTFVRFGLPNYNDYKDIFVLLVALLAAVGELSLCVWLLIQSFRKTRTISKEGLL